MAPPNQLMMQIAILLTSADVKDRNDRLHALSSMCGRTIRSMKEMDQDEAVDALATLQTWKRNGTLFNSVTQLLESFPSDGE